MSLKAIRDNLPSVDSVKQTLGMTPPLPKSYTAAVFEKKGQPLTIKEVELKEPQEGEILIKVLASGLCLTDSHIQAEMMGPLYALRIPCTELCS